MWPFSALRKKRYERRYRAALTVLLGVYAFDRLSDEAKQSVDGAVSKLLNNFWAAIPTASHRRWAGWDLRAAYRAVAMAELDIAPGLDALSWAELLPRRRPWYLRPTDVVSSFFPIDAATLDAKAFLRNHGFNIPDEDPWERGNLKPVDGGASFWEETGLLGHLESKRRQ